MSTHISATYAQQRQTVSIVESRRNAWGTFLARFSTYICRRTQACTRLMQPASTNKSPPLAMHISVSRGPKRAIVYIDLGDSAQQLSGFWSVGEVWRGGVVQRNRHRDASPALWPRAIFALVLFGHATHPSHSHSSGPIWRLSERLFRPETLYLTQYETISERATPQSNANGCRIAELKGRDNDAVYEGTLQVLVHVAFVVLGRRDSGFERMRKHCFASASPHRPETRRERIHPPGNKISTVPRPCRIPSLPKSSVCLLWLEEKLRTRHTYQCVVCRTQPRATPRFGMPKCSPPLINVPLLHHGTILAQC